MDSVMQVDTCNNPKNLIKIYSENEVDSNKLLECFLSVSRLNGDTLVITDKNSCYGEIRHIKCNSITINTLRIIKDILEIYKNYSVVVFDNFNLEMGTKEFLVQLNLLSKMYKQVLFVTKLEK